MSRLSERIPGVAGAVEAFDHLIDRAFPLSDDEARTYFTLSGASIAVGAWAMDKTVDWLEMGGGGSGKLEIAATIGAACLPAVASGVFWRQGWRAQGETETPQA